MVSGAPALRIVFFGTPGFAVPSLRELLTSQHQLVAVVTRADRPRDRGHRIAEPPVKTLAQVHGLTVLQPAALRSDSFLAALRQVAPDLGVVVAYGKLLPEELLRVPRLGMINVHASLLPKFRGAAPVERAIMAGESETGVTIMRVVRELDAGPILEAESRVIDRDETGAEVAQDLARRGARLLGRVVDALATGSVIERPQDDRLATYAPRLTKDEGAIDWKQPARVIHDQVRALRSWPHAFTYLDGIRLLVLRTAVSPGRAGEATAQPGEVVAADGDDLLVAALGEERVALREIQPEGRRAMTARAFLAGHRVEPGSVFTSIAERRPARSRPEV